MGNGKRETGNENTKIRTKRNLNLSPISAREREKIKQRKPVLLEEKHENSIVAVRK